MHTRVLEIISRDKILRFKNTPVINYSLPVAVPAAMLSKVTKTASEKQLLKPEAKDSPTPCPLDLAMGSDTPIADTPIYFMLLLRPPAPPPSPNPL